jgi:hypothetical protein
MGQCLLGREEGAVPRSLRVTPEDLLVSAATVDAHADGLWQQHGSADGRIEAAQVGVPVDHAQSLSAGAAAYEQTDAHNATDLNQMSEQVTDLDLGL